MGRGAQERDVRNFRAADVRRVAGGEGREMELSPETGILVSGVAVCPGCGSTAGSDVAGGRTAAIHAGAGSAGEGSRILQSTGVTPV